jgi:hypothetical protein
MPEELPDSHRIEYKKKVELLHQLKQLKKSPGWIHLCAHIASTNRERRASVEAPAYTMEVMQKQNYDKGVIMGSEMFAAGVDLEINRLETDIDALRRKVGDNDDLDTE